MFTPPLHFSSPHQTLLMLPSSLLFRQLHRCSQVSSFDALYPQPDRVVPCAETHARVTLVYYSHLGGRGAITSSPQIIRAGGQVTSQPLSPSLSVCRLHRDWIVRCVLSELNIHVFVCAFKKTSVHVNVGPLPVNEDVYCLLSRW